MARLTWQVRAQQDLHGIADYIAFESEIYAHRIARRAVDRANLLLEHPRQGRRVPEYEGPREIREVFVHSWRLIYEVTGEDILILALLHGARLLSNADPL